MCSCDLVWIQKTVYRFIFWSCCGIGVRQANKWKITRLLIHSEWLCKKVNYEENGYIIY